GDLRQLLEARRVGVSPVDRDVRRKSKRVLARLGPGHDFTWIHAPLIVEMILSRLSPESFHQTDVLAELVMHTTHNAGKPRSEIRIERVGVGVGGVDGNSGRGCARFRGCSEGRLSGVSPSADARRAGL